MPAARLQATPHAVRQFDVGGQDSAQVVEFVRHVGLAIQSYDGLTSASSVVRLVHMGPPLTLDNAEAGNPIHAFATVGLTADELLQIQLFVDELTSEYEAEEARPLRQYVIRPHATDPDEQFPFRRFNCAGFVVEAYRDAGIELLNLEDEVLPSVSLDTLKMAYPDHASSLDRVQLRAAYGLDGEGPWPVLLAGYVMNAMAREANEIRASPHTARIGDEFFPSRTPTATTATEDAQTEGDDT